MSISLKCSFIEHTDNNKVISHHPPHPRLLFSTLFFCGLTFDPFSVFGLSGFRLLFVCLSFCLSIFVSVYLSLSLSVCLYVCLSLSLSLSVPSFPPPLSFVIRRILNWCAFGHSHLYSVHWYDRPLACTGLGSRLRCSYLASPVQVPRNSTRNLWKGRREECRSCLRNLRFKFVFWSL